MSVWHNFRNILFVRGFSSNWDYPAIEIINLRREAQIHRSLVVNWPLFAHETSSHLDKLWKSRREALPM
jgi:hypothetical protein